MRGTFMVDARLTPLDASTTPAGSTGGSVTDSSGAFRLTVPAGALSNTTDLRLTAKAPHALRAILPLGWSPIGSTAVGPPGTTFALPAQLALTAPRLAGLSVELVRYDVGQHAWIVEEIALAGGSSITASVSGGGDYAFVVADDGVTAPPAAVTGEPLLGAEAVEIQFGLSATSDVHASRDAGRCRRRGASRRHAPLPSEAAERHPRLGAR